MRLLFFVAFSAALAAPAPTSIIQTIAGTDWTFTAGGKPAINAPIGFPVGVAADAAGNFYIADDANHQVYRVGTDGVLNVVAGNGVFLGVYGNGGDGGDARNATLGFQLAVATGADGSVYVAFFGGTIRKIGTDGVITTLANLGFNSGPAQGGQGQAITVDASGNVYYADFIGNRIFKISPDGAVTRFAGTGAAAATGDGGPAVSATLNQPHGVHADSHGNLYIADTANRAIRKVDPQGIISTIRTSTALNSPVAVDVDAAGNLYVLDGVQSPAAVIRKIAPDGTVSIIAGGGTPGFGGDSGPASKAAFNFPTSLALDGAGSLFVSDANNGRIRKIAPDNTIATAAGNGLYRFTPDGTAANLAFFKVMAGVTIGPDGLLYIADNADARIRRIQRDGTIATVAGNGQNLFSGNGPIPATSPIFLPASPVFDSKGNLYFIENRFLVRRVTPDGVMTTYAGGGSNNPGNNGKATAAVLTGAQGLGVDAAGNLYISEAASRIRKVAPDGTITTFAGTGAAGFSGDGGPAAQAQINYPLDITFDPQGNLYFVDALNRRIRKIDAQGIITTYAGGGAQTADGIPATQAALSLLGSGLAFDSAGNLYIAEAVDNVVPMVSPAGIITTLAGTGTPGFAGDGGPAIQALLNGPAGLAVDSAGAVYIADTGNSRIRVVTAAVPNLAVANASLSFTVKTDDPPPVPQQITVGSSITGVPFTLRVSTSGGGNWLLATASSVQAPATLSITVDPSNLAPGNYQGTVTVTPGIAGVAPQTIAVALVVQPGSPSALAVDVDGVAFAALRGGGPVSKTVRITNPGSGSEAFFVKITPRTGGNWLSASPGQGAVTGATPASLVVTADPTGLQPGTYTALLGISDEDGQHVFSLPVTLTIGTSGQLIRLAQTGLTFTAVVNGGSTPPQTIAVLNSGSTPLQFSTRVLTDSALPGWLSATPSGSRGLTVNVNPAGLAAGNYWGRVEVVSASADNSPQEITVVLQLLPEGTDPGPIVQPVGLVFTGVEGAGNPSSQTITLSNLSSDTITFGSGVATLDGGKYITYQPSTSSLPPGSLPVVVQPVFDHLSAGVYRGAITFVFSDGSVQAVAILIVIAPAGTKIGGGAAGSQAVTSGCTPTQLLPLITSLGSNFNVPAAFPTPLVMRVVDDCGAPVTDGSTATSFSNGDAPLSLLSLGDGNWSATWVSRNNAPRVSLTGTSQTPQAKLLGKTQLTGGLGGGANPPVIAAGGVLSASSFGRQLPLAPGAMVSVFGSHLGNGSSQAQSLPLGTQLAGTVMVVAGKALPLLYSSDGQVNAVLPFNLPVNTPLQIVASNGAQVSTPEEIAIAPAQPGIFTFNGSGTGQGDIFVAAADGSAHLASTSSPAKSGDVVVVYCSGLGAVDQPVADGAAAPAAPLANTVNPVTMTIGDVNAPVFFAGLTPGFAGLYQVNAIVPDKVTPGDQLPVVITAAGQSSPVVTMSVR